MNATRADVTSQLALDVNSLASLKQQAKADPKQALSAAAGQFEALFLQMLLKSMREALPHDGPLDSESTKTYTGMFDQQIAQQLAKKGLGVSDMLVKQLSRGLATGKDAPQQTDTVNKPASTSATPPAMTLKPTPMTLKPTPMTLKPPAVSLKASTESTVSSTVQGFIDKLRPYAEAVAQKMGVPAQYLIAQAGLESGWGRSQPKAADGSESRNLFGIKASSSWKGAVVQARTTEYTAGQAAKTRADFRAYASYGDAFTDFAKLLQSGRRYAGALANSHDAEKYAASLQKAGYATDPKYADKLARAIQTVERYAPVMASRAPVQVVAIPADKTSDQA